MNWASPVLCVLVLTVHLASSATIAFIYSCSGFCRNANGIATSAWYFLITSTPFCPRIMEGVIQQRCADGGWRCNDEVWHFSSFQNLSHAERGCHNSVLLLSVEQKGEIQDNCRPKRAHITTRVYVSVKISEVGKLTVKLLWEVVGSQDVQKYSGMDLGQDSPMFCLHCHQSFCSRSIQVAEMS